VADLAITRLGIQGGRGSFNEEAARQRLRGEGGGTFELVYLHTTEAVLRALHDGSVDCGQFAIHNSIAGPVEESASAMSRHEFTIVERFDLRIRHALMSRCGVALGAIDSVMTHPHVLRQCRETLRNRYPQLRQLSGEGDLIDHALVAERMANGLLPATLATAGSHMLARLNGLDILDDDLQDSNENFTTFVWVR
jgi:prephenate dehydratase